MNDLVEMMRADAGAEKVKREAAAATTRANFPESCATADLFVPKFGPVSMKYAEEGGRSIGKPAPKGMDWFAAPSSKRVESARRKA